MKNLASESKAALAPAGGALRFDAEILRCRALVIDANPVSRSILAAQLRDLGVGTVVQTGRVPDARRQLEAQEFDIVLCEQEFQGAPQSGQDLLDDLRRAQLLPYSTVFVMVTSEASYAAVAEAAESALDSYLLKPHTAHALAARIQQARQRKKMLKDIFTAIEDGRRPVAAHLCVQRFEARGAYWLHAARIGAELLLDLGAHEPARRLYEAVVAEQPLPWARLGIARAQIEGGHAPAGRRTLESLIADHPGFADAYDVLGRLQLDQGAFVEALATSRNATRLTPGSITRLQRQGMLAFCAGEAQEARLTLERATTLGASSRMFDSQTVVLLAVLRYADREPKGLQRCRDIVEQALQAAPDNRRLQRFAAVIRIFGLALRHEVEAALAAVGALAAQIKEADFDFEAGSNLVTVLSHLGAAGLPVDAADDWIDTLALRFCTTRGLSELLAHAAAAHDPFAQRVRDQHAAVTALAERAMSHSLAGEPRAAATSLLADGERTMNIKLVDMARMVLQRHAENIPDATALLATTDELRQRCAGAALPLPLGTDGGRRSGGIALRSRDRLPGGSATASVAGAGNTAGAT